jgi:hypothetical protein
MRGGKFMFMERYEIMKLLKNLIINNVDDDDKTELCAKQQTTPTPMATEKQPLLSQPELLKNGENVDKLINELYNDFLKTQNENGEYKYHASRFTLLHDRIIQELKKNKDITFFDSISNTSILDILSPVAFNDSLLSSSKTKIARSMMTSKMLVYSMFALSAYLLMMRQAGGHNLIFSFDYIVCPPRANV